MQKTIAIESPEDFSQAAGETTGQSPDSVGLEHENMGGIVEAALEIAQRQADNIRHLKASLLEHNDDAALNWAKQLCGIDD